MPDIDFISEAMRRMAADGLLVDNPIADGAIHRCGLVDKPRSKSGAYILHSDDMPVAWWRNWKTDTEQTYCAKSQKEMSKKERKAYQERMAAIKEKTRQEREKARKAVECSPKIDPLPMRESSL